MASSSDISDIPLIDFGPFIHGSTSDREVVAALVDTGLCSTGFICLENYGIDLHRVGECFNWVSA
jgi:isopenicillin N synthase-like dioxygenase